MLALTRRGEQHMWSEKEQKHEGKHNCSSWLPALSLPFPAASTFPRWRSAGGGEVKQSLEEGPRSSTLRRLPSDQTPKWKSAEESQVIGGHTRFVSFWLPVRLSAPATTLRFIVYAPPLFSRTVTSHQCSSACPLPDTHPQLKSQQRSTLWLDSTNYLCFYRLQPGVGSDLWYKLHLCAVTTVYSAPRKTRYYYYLYMF